MNPSLDGGASGSIRAGRRKLSGKIGCGRQSPGCSTEGGLPIIQALAGPIDGIERGTLEPRPEISRAFAPRQGGRLHRNGKMGAGERGLRPRVKGPEL
jgi:hypothetical protein